MSGYTKNIAVIKQLKEGFSADGGPLTGIIKAERYGSVLGIEVTFINFAPLSEGRYVTALSDGSATLIVENGHFEGVSDLNTGNGFAALVCYINTQVTPVASAVCGNFHAEALAIKREVEKAERIRSSSEDTAAAEDGKAEEKIIYSDEAIAEENYYEYAENNESGGAVCEDPQKKDDGSKALQNEAAVGSVEEEKTEGGLAGGNFYSRLKNEIEGIFSAYPAEEELEKIVENSRWVKIYYGDGKYYVFGVLYCDGSPKYICYGVPATQSTRPPESMQGLASFIPCSPEERDRGYWVMYQDAETGASIPLNGV